MKQSPIMLVIRNFLSLVFLILFSLSSFSGEKSLVKDPYKFVWDAEGQVGGITRFFLDINDDGQPEIFVGANALIGNAGGEFEIFQKSGAGFIHLGAIFTHPENLNVLSSKHHGFRDLRTCAHYNADSCDLGTFEFNGSKYKPGKSKMIRGVDLPKDYVRAKVAPERSDKLIWKP